MRFAKYIYGADGKVRLCDCGRPAVIRTTGNENKCERCLALEANMEAMNRATAAVGFTIENDRRGQLPQYHAIEPPISGASLQISEPDAGNDMSSPFLKNQILVHNTWGECVAIRAWNDRETVCLVTSTGWRQILMNCFLKPVYGPGPHDHNVAFVDDETLAELESKLAKGQS